jgi:hypothetical protein
MENLEIQELAQLLRKDHISFVFDAVRDRITRLLEHYQQLPESEREAVRAQFGPDHASKLSYYAGKMAVDAVRKNSIQSIKLGLLAAAMDGGQYDQRVTLPNLCMLHHSAKKIGADPASLFTDAAAYGSDSARDLILQYLARGNKDIRAFRLEEAYGREAFLPDEPEGFRYASIGP